MIHILRCGIIGFRGENIFIFYELSLFLDGKIIGDNYKCMSVVPRTC